MNWEGTGVGLISYNVPGFAERDYGRPQKQFLAEPQLLTGPFLAPLGFKSIEETSRNVPVASHRMRCWW
jgi:hypothetical protein